MRSALVRVLLATSLSCASSALALAGSPYAPARHKAPFDWSGLYLGGNLGGAWSDIDWSQNRNYFTSTTIRFVDGDSSFSPEGIFGGAIGGGNVQVGSWVFGAEASFSGADLEETKASPWFDTDVFSAKVDWLTSVEGRIGYAYYRFLVFGKGGWAGGKLEATLTSDDDGGVVASKKTFADGYTFGGGVEYALTGNLVLGIAYDYTRLSYDVSTVCPDCGTGSGGGTPNISGVVEINSVTARASYLFNP